MTKIATCASKKVARNITMSKEIINPKSIRANTPDWQEGYEQGLLAGYTKSIVLIRHLQKVCEYPSLAWGRLEKAMELISENIETNNNE
jgi:hypothetical protein